MGPESSTASAARGASRYGRHLPQMVALWESSVCEALRRVELAERMGDARVRARMMVLAAFCRAHASRLLARMDGMGCGRLPLPVPPVASVFSDWGTAALSVSAVKAARTRRERYERLAETARDEKDLSSAWVADIGRQEEEDAARELANLTQDIAAQKGMP